MLKSSPRLRVDDGHIPCSVAVRWREHLVQSGCAGLAQCMTRSACVRACAPSYTAFPRCSSGEDSTGFITPSTSFRYGMEVYKLCRSTIFRPFDHPLACSLVLSFFSTPDTRHDLRPNSGWALGGLRGARGLSRSPQRRAFPQGRSRVG